MSARGTNFLHQWLDDNLAGILGSDVLSISDKLFADAKALGIGSNEIEEDTGSVASTKRCSMQWCTIREE